MTDELVPSTKEKLGTYDAIETAKPDEPLFPIQGGDPFGPATVLHWVSLARAAGMAETDEKRADRLLRKARDAELIAWQMQTYQRGEVEQEGERAQYNEPTIAIDATQDLERQRREARIKGAARLANVIAQATEVCETLTTLDICAVECIELTHLVDAMKITARMIEPRRDNERS